MIDHLSYSSINSFLTCQRRWSYHYIEHITVPVSGELIRGSAYHEAVAYGYSAKAIYQDLPLLDDLKQVYSHSWDKSIGNRIIMDEDEKISIPAVDFGDKDSGKLKNDGLRLLEIYYNQYMTKIQPAKVEQKVNLDVNGIKVVSVIDLIYEEDWDSCPYCGYEQPAISDEPPKICPKCGK